MGMGALSPILRNIEGPRIGFWCPACQSMHAVRVGMITDGPHWTWNGDVLYPTLNPSLNIETIRKDLTLAEEALYDQLFGGPDGPARALKDPRFRYVCHSVVTNGKITFCPDSTHELAGKTVDLPPFPGYTP